MLRHSRDNISEARAKNVLSSVELGYGDSMTWRTFLRCFRDQRLIVQLTTSQRCALTLNNSNCKKPVSVMGLLYTANSIKPERTTAGLKEMMVMSKFGSHAQITKVDHYRPKTLDYGQFTNAEKYRSGLYLLIVRPISRCSLLQRFYRRTGILFFNLIDRIAQVPARHMLPIKCTQVCPLRR
jgi:hypothetical protein